jgi:hypothetical protein
VKVFFDWDSGDRVVRESCLQLLHSILREGWREGEEGGGGRGREGKGEGEEGREGRRERS